jgi:GWxTD domain-containing protein
MKHVFKYFSLFLLFLPISLNAQTNNPENATEYNMGIQALLNNDTLSAEKLFKESIRENSDPHSQYELAKIYFNQNTIYKRAEARSLLESAIFKEPNNLKYRYLLAKIYNKISDGMAYHVYKDIIEIDSTQALALYHLGKIKEKEFNEYHNSYFKASDVVSLSYEKYAQDDFNSAKNFLQKSIKYDSLFQQAYLHLSFLYEDSEEPAKGIPLLEKLKKLYPENKNAHLYLGLLYYENNKIKDAFEEYQEALKLMTDSERVDFTFNSVKELLKPVLGSVFKKYSDNELHELINQFWQINDPLYLTGYNERLLEHYSRVAYANLRFTVKYNNTPGWKTDRGEAMIRYGKPLRQERYRPTINAGGKTQMFMKTDVWHYKYFSLGFYDQFMNGNYVYSEPMPGSMFITQYPGDSPMLMQYLRKDYFEGYTPKFAGPVINVPFNIVQLKDKNYNYTDVYVNYGLTAADSLKKGNVYLYNHEWGLFFFDSLYNPIVKLKKDVPWLPVSHKIKTSGDSSLLVNSLKMTVYPDTGMLAFEIIRNSDKGVSSNHFNFKVKKFKPYKLGISDLILASKIEKNNSSMASIIRGNIDLLPNPANTFSAIEPLYLYYELYNLKLDENGFNNYEQKLVIKRVDHSSSFSKTVNSLLNIVGMGKKEEEVIVTTNYQTEGKDPQMYFKVEMNDYKPGNYIIKIIVKDNLSGKEVSSQTTLYYK